MVISWDGEGCFKLQNGDKVVLTDIPSKDSGISTPKLKPEILIKTITLWPDKVGGFKDAFVIRGAGEYDVNGIKIQGEEVVDESNDKFFKTVYVIKWEDIKIGLFGVIEKKPSPKILEQFEDIDILIAPGGGAPFISQKDIASIVKQLNPKVFIPSFFKIKGLKRKAGDIKELVGLFNGDAEDAQEKLVIKKKELQEIKKTKLIRLKV